MRIVMIIIVVVVALFFLLPILSGKAPLPEDVSANQIGSFIGGFFKYWIDVLRSALAAL